MSKKIKEFNKKVSHPVQSYEWGEFRNKNGYAIERFGFEDKNYTVLFKKLPFLKKTIGFLTQSSDIDEAVIGKLAILAKKHNSIFIKTEPYIYKKIENRSELDSFRFNLKKHGLIKGKDLYPVFSNIIDLTKTKKELLMEMKSKTRYNTRLARRKGVEVVIDRKNESFEEYLKLLAETTERQGFYAHSKKYQRQMWRIMKEAGIAYVARAIYNKETLSAWIVYVFGDKLYYPYGASTRRKKGLMATYLLVWEVMKFGKSRKCTDFDMWGCLGPNPDKKDPWYGLTRFKRGFGGDLVEFVGAFDLVLDRFWYRIYKLIDLIRWFWLKLKAKN